MVILWPGILLIIIGSIVCGLLIFSSISLEYFWKETSNMWGKKRDTTSLVIAIIGLFAIIIFTPIKYETAILTEYKFYKYEHIGKIEYISPFTHVKEIVEINSIELYNRMSNNEHIRMKKNNSLFIQVGEDIFLEDIE